METAIKKLSNFVRAGCSGRTLYINCLTSCQRTRYGESKYIKKIPIYLEIWTLGSLSPLGTKLQQWQWKMTQNKISLSSSCPVRFVFLTSLKYSVQHRLHKYFLACNSLQTLSNFNILVFLTTSRAISNLSY